MTLLAMESVVSRNFFWTGLPDRMRIDLIVVSLVLLIVTGPKFYHGAELDDRTDVVNAVRCRVRCLSLMPSSSLHHDLSHVYESVTLLTCLQEPECEACLRPCNQPFTTASLCEEACQLPKFDHACRESCLFLKQVNTIRPGQCPSETDVTGKAALCVTVCQSDADCKPHLKCCSNSCGWTCQHPRHLLDDTPEIPDRPIVRERPKAGSVELRWNSVTSNLTSGPVLYIIDSRWNIGREESEADMTGWQQVAQTTGTSTVVSDITPGHWYQFRVTAVNINGRRGSSPPTKAFTLSKEPRRPGPPTNVTEGDTLIMGGKVAVNLHWFHPKKSDLPISRYKIVWSRKLKTSDTESEHEFRQVIPGDQLMFQIPDLEPDTTYFVQIQAISQYGESRLKSDKVSLYVTTYPLPRSANEVVGSRTQQPANTIRSVVPTPATPLDILAHQPFYQSGVLKANVTWSLPAPSNDDGPQIDRFFVFWSPEACIADHVPDDGLAKVMSGSTQDTFFVIYNLRFDCRYLIRVQSVTNQGDLGVTRHLSLATPACFETPVLGNTKPDCPNNVLRLPKEPSNLHHSFFISSSNITAKLSWDGPEADSPPISGYRVIWGHMSQTHGSPIDASTTLTKVLSRDSRSFVINGLLEGTTYAVRLQALSRVGAGRAVALHFTTPLLQFTPRDPPFIEEGEESEDDEDEIEYNTQGRMYGASDAGRSSSNHQMSPLIPSASVAANTSPIAGLYLCSCVSLLHVSSLFRSFK